MAAGLIGGLAIWALLIAAFGVRQVLVGAFWTFAAVCACIGAVSIYGALRLTLYRWRHRCL